METKEQTAPAAHTPGPWEATDEVQKIDGSTVIRYSGGIVAFAADFNRYDRDAERLANAALIASAPQLAADRADLLAALRGLLATIGELGNWADAAEDETVQAAIAVIARVEARHG